VLRRWSRCRTRCPRSHLPLLGADWTLCLTPPLHRTPLWNSGGSIGIHDCTGTLSFDFTAASLAQHGLGVGTRACTQIHGRDPGFPIPDNVQLSSAVAFVVVP
jgi:hypothetical protein